MTDKSRVGKGAVRAEDVSELMRDCGWPRSTGPARRAIVSLQRHLDERTQAAQAVVTAYYVRIREDGLGMEQADMDLGNAIERLYHLVGEVPIER